MYSNLSGRLIFEIDAILKCAFSDRLLRAPLLEYHISQKYTVLEGALPDLSDAPRDEDTFDIFSFVTPSADHFCLVWYHQIIGSFEHLGLLLVCGALLVSLLKFISLTIEVCYLSFETLYSRLRVLQLCLASFRSSLQHHRLLLDSFQLLF